SRRRHTRWPRDWSSDVCSSDLTKGRRREANMRRTEFIKDTKQRLIRRRDALRRALAGDISMLRSHNEQAVGDEVDAAIATEQSRSEERRVGKEWRCRWSPKQTI